jgi:hypothetical protein
MRLNRRALWLAGAPRFCRGGDAHFLHHASSELPDGLQNSSELGRDLPVYLARHHMTQDFAIGELLEPAPEFAGTGLFGRLRTSQLRALCPAVRCRGGMIGGTGFASPHEAGWSIAELWLAAPNHQPDDRNGPDKI